MSNRLFALLLAPLAALALSSAAAAQEPSLRLAGKIGKVSVGIDLPLARTHCPAPPPPPAGCWEWREERVWIEGYESRVWVQPVYETRYDHCGRRYQVIVRAGYWQTVCEPGHWEVRKHKVWVPNYYPSERRVRFGR